VDAWLIDVDSADVNLDALPRPQPGARSPVVLLATSGTIIAQDLERRFGTATIIAKPVRRDTLYRALAAAAGREVSVPQPTVEHDQAPLQRLTGHVLVAEDNAVNALVVEGMLAELGCTAKVAADGREAVTQAVSEEYDLILMDLHMPEIDGLEAARRIRQAAGVRRVPIVALTASTVETHRDECLIAGMDDFLSKPFTLNEFHRVLSRLLPAARVDGAPVSIEAPADAGLDTSVLRGIRAMQRRDQPDLLGRVLSLYATNSHRQLADLRAAVDAGDLPAVARHAHSLKSSSANVGATEVARLALALERAGLDNDAITARSLIGPLATAHDSTLVSLDRMLKEAAA
jgi:CheY-like chemotaxis protein/HPt (histidine-containing phosphotransfer) domain-containing protein